MTEEEAKEKWCPFARTIIANADGSHAGQQPAFNRIERAKKTAIPIAGYCIASACMAWRWNYISYVSPETGEPSIGEKIVHGHCGLAGRP